MAKAFFKKRDKNRYRKVYPYIRKAPVWDYCSNVPVEIEIGEIEYNSASTGTYYFTSTFTSAPVITAVSYDAYNNGTADVNVYISSVDTTKVVINTSANFTGKVHFHAIRVECP